MFEALQKTYKEATKRYGVSHGSVSAWVKRFKSGTLAEMRQPKERQPKSLRTREFALEKEIQALKQELANLYMMNQLLKKAQSYSEHVRKDNSSSIISGSSDPSNEGAN